MSQANSAAARDIASVLHPYTNLDTHRSKGPLVISRGEGVRVWDEDGREYIEGLSGLWCAGLGFGESELVDAAVEQMRRLPFYHPFGGKSHNPIIDLAERLKAIAPGRFAKVFFAGSGSEANDSIVKIIRYYNNAIGRPLKKKIISRQRAYHGVTLFTSGLTGLPNNHRDFDMPMPGILHAECPHFYRNALPGETEEAFATRLADSLEQLILREGPETIAAFIAEPVMGAGGVIVPPQGYFEKVQAVLRRHDIFFIADEVICGFGRTGSLWGSQTFGIEPDFVACAKQLTSGYMPISAALVPEKVDEVLIEQSKKIGVFAHGFTYGGHPVAAAVALRALDIYDRRNIVGHVNAVAPRFQERLRRLGDHPVVGEARGVGLIGAVELVADKATKKPFDAARGAGAYCNGRAEHHGLITRALGDTVALCPPMIITESEIDQVFDRLERALDDTAVWAAA